MAQTAPATAAAQTATATSPDYVGETMSHWMAAGFVGANWGNTATTASVDFGGQLGYLWHGMLGAELLADFAPNFDMSNIFLAERPSVNSYMANAVIALPIGTQGQVQPYVSGGFGAMQLRTTVFSTAINPLLTDTPASATDQGDQVKWGWDAGGGMTIFMGKIGLRGDVRYYKAETSNTFSGTPTENFTEALLSGISFWRANGGLAFRW
jgi:hypothetical protein